MRAFKLNLLPYQTNVDKSFCWWWKYLFTQCSVSECYCFEQQIMMNRQAAVVNEHVLLWYFVFFLYILIIESEYCWGTMKCVVLDLINGLVSVSYMSYRCAGDWIGDANHDILNLVYKFCTLKLFVETLADGNYNVAIMVSKYGSKIC